MDQAQAGEGVSGAVWPPPCEWPGCVSHFAAEPRGCTCPWLPAADGGVHLTALDGTCTGHVPGLGMPLSAPT